MKIEQLTTVLVRFFAIFMLLTIIFHYGMAMSAIIMQNHKLDVEGNIVIFATFAVLLAAIGLLLYFAPAIARAIIPAKTSDEAAVNVSAERLETLFFSVVGLWLVVSAMPEIVQYTIYMLVMDAVSSKTEIGLFGQVVKMLTGLWLLIGSKGVVNTLRKLRGGEG